MKLIIDIPNHLYSVIKNKECTRNNALTEAVYNGTPIPDNATNGDVIKILFKPNWIRRMDDVVREEYEFDAEWWASLYQKGGNDV